MHLLYTPLSSVANMPFLLWVLAGSSIYFILLPQGAVKTPPIAFIIASPAQLSHLWVQLSQYAIASASPFATIIIYVK